MEGVQILNQFEVITKTIFNWSAFWVGALIGLGIALVAGIIFGLLENDWCAFLTMFVATGVLALILIGPFAGHLIDPTPTAYETHYEVSINDEVNMKDFMDKYEIIETRGAIYTVREKDVTEG
jgi:hypothetical protein